MRDARRPALSGGAARDADPPLLLYAQGRARAARRAGAGDRRQPQPDAARRSTTRAHFARAPEPGRPDRRLGPGARHRRRRPRRRRSPAPAARSRWSAPGSTASTRRATARWRTGSPSEGLMRQRVRARHAAAGGELPAAQPHHRRPGARHAGGRGGAAVGLADHGAPGRRGRARGVRDSGLDPLAAVARLPRADQAGRQAGRHARRTSSRSCSWTPRRRALPRRRPPAPPSR